MRQIKIWLALITLSLCACGQSPTSGTSSVTNGDLVLGIVPLQNGESKKDQRYRLMVCKKMKSYDAEALADKNICRSALLTKSGEEIDLVGNKLAAEHQDVVRLPVENAAEAKMLEAVPAIAHIVKTNHIMPIAIALGVIGAAAIVGGSYILAKSRYDMIEKVFGVSFAGFGGALSFLAAKQASIAASSKARMERIGDDGERTYPKVIREAAFLSANNEYSKGDTLAMKHNHEVNAYNFNNISALEQQEDLRAILVAIARFYNLQTNEAALSL